MDRVGMRDWYPPREIPLPENPRLGVLRLPPRRLPPSRPRASISTASSPREMASVQPNTETRLICSLQSQRQEDVLSKKHLDVKNVNKRSQPDSLDSPYTRH